VLTVSPAHEIEFALHVRVPGWSRNSRVLVDGKPVSGVTAGEYLAIKRQWKPGDKVTLEFGMEPQLIASNPLVRENNGKLALSSGPLIYCLEQPDQAAPVDDLVLDKPGKPFHAEFEKDLLGGVKSFTHEGAAFAKPLKTDPLYEPVALEPPDKTKPVELRFIPYYAWANRGQSAMEVWVPLR
jgi:DUF1680 family protein